MAENLEKLDVVETAAETAVESGKKISGKAIGIGLAVVGTCGLVLFAVKLIKKAKAKKAAKTAEETVPTPVKDEATPEEEVEA